MELFVRPITRTWNWIELHWGYPGQIFFILIFIFLILAIFWFVGNRGGGGR